MPNESQAEYPGTELDAMAVAVNYHRWIVEKFRPYLGESVAEVGAGIGSVSKLLLETGIQRLASFEPSRRLFSTLAAELRDESRAQAIPNIFSPQSVSGSIDSVVYINVLEHIEDDLQEMRNARLALRPGGHLLVFVRSI